MGDFAECFVIHTVVIAVRAIAVTVAATAVADRGRALRHAGVLFRVVVVLQ